MGGKYEGKCEEHSNLPPLESWCQQWEVIAAFTFIKKFLYFRLRGSFGIFDVEDAQRCFYFLEINTFLLVWGRRGYSPWRMQRQFFTSLKYITWFIKTRISATKKLKKESSTNITWPLCVFSLLPPPPSTFAPPLTSIVDVWLINGANCFMARLAWCWQRNQAEWGGPGEAITLPIVLRDGRTRLRPGALSARDWGSLTETLRRTTCTSAAPCKIGLQEKWCSFDSVCGTSSSDKPLTRWFIPSINLP